MIYALVAVLLILIFFVYKQSSGYNIVEYDITSDKDVKPVRFVMLSDLHDTDVTHDHNKRLLDSIDSLSPDFVILAGDMITSYMQPKYNSCRSLEFLKELSARHRVYYGLGNHEQRYRFDEEKFPGKYKELESFIKECGITLLSDSFSDVDDPNIRIYGFDIPLDNYRRGAKPKLGDTVIGDAIGICDENRFNILVAHTPDYFDEYVRWHPDLVLSGHLHGGIVGIPGIGGLLSPQLELFPKYYYGKYTKDNTTMIVSRGIGWHTIPVRIFNKAEIVLVNIGREDKTGDTNGDKR